jgi:NitT/TauT family transport system substrate-binding protein
VLLAVALAAAGCQQKAEREAQTAPTRLILAVQPAPYSGLIAVAVEKGFFKQAGVEVTIKLYPSGLDALTKMQGGEAQVATVSDMAFASRMNEDPSLRVVASIELTVGNQIVARKDRNIREPADLKGKKIGFTPNTVSDYFLYAFLLTNHLSPDDANVVSIPAARQVEAVVKGEVDAVSAFEIYAFVAKEQLGKMPCAGTLRTTSAINGFWLPGKAPPSPQRRQSVC